VLAAAAAGAGDRASITPIQKVLNMMEELKAKAQKEKQEEIDTFNEFTKFCKDTIRAKGYAIKDGTELIEKLKADIQKYDADKMVAQEAAKTLGEAVDVATHEKAEATEVRQKEKKDFKGTHADYVAQLEDMAVGVAELKKMQSATDSAAAASFIQKMSTRPHMPPAARRVLASFLATSSSERSLASLEAGQPAAPGFESQSDGVVDMMKDLSDKVLEEKTALETEESNAQHAYDMTAQMFDQQIKKNSEERSDKLSQQKKAEASSAEAKGELADSSNSKAEDEKYVAELTAICEQKSSDFEVRQQVRAEELKAIDQAMEIIGGDSVSGAGAKHLPQLVQRRVAALAQLRSATDSNAQRPLQTAAASLLSMRARELHSGILSALAVRVSADPFVKVRKMITDMITKLNDEANEEAEHKGFCDEELANNQATRDEKSAKVAELTANIEELTGKSAQLSKEISQLNADVASLDEAIAEATKIRGEEKEKNTGTIADAKEAISAVSQAVKVLKDFYAKAATSTSFVQAHRRGPADDVPGTFDEPFTGTGGEGGILGMLDVILSDFQRLEAETTEIEAANLKEYEDFSADSTENKDAKTQDSKDKARARTKTEHSIRLANKELKANQVELDAAKEYYEKLKPSCVDAGISYEDRVAQRENEIESLKEALKILMDEA